MRTEPEQPYVKRGELAYLHDRAGEKSAVVVRIELLTAVYVYWQVVQTTHPDYRPGQHGRTFRHLNLVVPGAPAPLPRVSQDNQGSHDGPALITTG